MPRGDDRSSRGGSSTASSSRAGGGSTRASSRGGDNSSRGGGPSSSSRARSSSRNSDASVGTSASTSSRASRASSSVIDPNKPAWWNEQKKAERKKAEDARKDAIRAENERKKIEAGNVATYGRSAAGGGRQITDSRVGVRNVADGAERKKDRGGAGIYDDEKGDDSWEKEQKLKNKLGMDMMDVQDDRIGKRTSADEELQGKSIWDLVDRGTLMVGCCLILIVIIAVTIPVALISEDPPYVAPKEPPKPSASPTRARDLEVEAIGERLAKITPGGMETLTNPSTAHYRAWMWLTYEDGMQLGAAKDHLHQRFVLMVIYFISGPWTPVEGRLEWGSPVHECEWEGIYCKDVEELEDELEGRIEELLEVGREDGIKIDVPQRVCNRLHLRQRLVSGEVPAEFSLLYYLQHLDLENNQLVGGLPTPLYKLFNLQTLFLEQNELTNVAAIGEYRHLEHLALSKNNFQGPLPESFQNLKKLKTLYLHTNGFTGEVFDVLKNFEAMELLDIAHNSFSGTLPTEFGNMKNLTSLFIGHNNFEGTLPEELKNCKNLKQIQTDGSHDIGGEIPSFLGQLSLLEFIKLDTCGFNGTLPMSLGNLEKLTFLDVNSNMLTGKIPSQLGKATNLVTLGLANNDFEGEVPSELGKLTKLEKMYLQNTDLFGAMPDEVCALRQQENQTVLEELFVPCDIECEIPTCCTICS